MEVEVRAVTTLGEILRPNAKSGLDTSDFNIDALFAGDAERPESLLEPSSLTDNFPRENEFVLAGVKVSGCGNPSVGSILGTLFAATGATAVEAAAHGTISCGSPLYWSAEGRTIGALFRPFLGCGLPAADSLPASAGIAGDGFTMRVSKGKNASMEPCSNSPALILALNGLPQCSVAGMIATGVLPVFTQPLDAS